MKLDQKYSGNVFILSSDDYAASRAVIYGMPMDYTVSFRPGSRFGPSRIREVSIGLEEYSPYLDKSLEDITYFDAGDLLLPFGNAGRSLEIIGEYVRGLLADGKFPLGLGGEHLVSWPVIREVYAKYPDLALIHIDAHADLREQYEGEPLSHSTPIRKAAALMGGRNIYQFGIRSGSREEFRFGRENINFYPFEVLEPLKKVLPELAGRPVYLTIDIDVLDPMCAPHGNRGSGRHYVEGAACRDSRDGRFGAEFRRRRHRRGCPGLRSDGANPDRRQQADPRNAARLGEITSR